MSVAAKLNKVMNAVARIKKDGKLQGGAGYAFLSEEAVTGILHDAFADVGLAIVPTDYEILDNRLDTTYAGKNLYNTRIRAVFELIDTEDGDVRRICTLGEGSDSGDKTLNKCMTAAYKYALRQSCMISTGDDPDKDTSNETAAAEKAKHPSTASKQTSKPERPRAGAAEAAAASDQAATPAEKSHTLQESVHDQKRVQYLNSINFCRQEREKLDPDFGRPIRQWQSIRSFFSLQDSNTPPRAIAHWESTAPLEELVSYGKHLSAKVKELTAEAAAKAESEGKS